jgi:hypothetical protein
VIDALPEVRLLAEDVYDPALKVMLPVGVPDPPLTLTTTFNDCAAVIADDAGVTVTVGVTGF